jgi:hypothetical protein
MGMKGVNRGYRRIFEARYNPFGVFAPNLAADEVDRFLEFVFSDVAERPKPLTLSEGAAVARYLFGLSRELAGQPGYNELDRMAKVIWATILQRAPFKPSSKRQTIRFLTRHKRTYLNSFDMLGLIKTIEKSPEPRPRSVVDPAPLLMSRGRSVGGHGEPRLQNDLSERICAAYYLLHRSGIKNARGRIARALNQFAVPRTRRGQGGAPWDSDEVAERVKQHRAKLKRRSAPDQRGRLADQERNALADRWVSSFRTAAALRKPPSA